MEKDQILLAKKRTRDRLVPYQWFWTDQFGQRMNFRDWALSRKFTLGYLVISWGLVSVLGFASTRDCDTWQLSIGCDQAIWMIKMYTEPFVYIKSWFTAPFFHNGLDHLLFVTVLGMMFPVQSFEVQNGARATMIIFFATYVLVGIFNGFLFNYSLVHWSDNSLVTLGFERSWMGGSVGFYGVIGALSFASRKKWFLILLAASFEVFNLTVIGIDVHISYAHMSSCLVGFITCWMLSRTKLVDLS